MRRAAWRDEIDRNKAVESAKDVVMRAAVPLSEMMSPEEYQEAFEE